MSGNDGFVSGGAVKTIQIGALQPASKVKTQSSNESFIHFYKLERNIEEFKQFLVFKKIIQVIVTVNNLKNRENLAKGQDIYISSKLRLFRILFL